MHRYLLGIVALAALVAVFWFFGQRVFVQLQVGEGADLEGVEARVS